MVSNNTFQALSDPSRRKILELLKKKDMSVSQILTHFDITMPSLSHHLNILKQADLITFRRCGQELIYSLNLSVFEELAKAMIKFFK